MTLTRTLAAIAAGATLLAAACSDGGTSTPIVTPDRTGWETAKLALASSCDDAERFFREAAVEAMELNLEQNRRCFVGECMWMMEGDATLGSPAEAAPPRDDDTPDEWSETNTQVDGVDEADIVKTNGTHLFGLFGKDLVIMKSWPAAETGELARVHVKGWPNGFFLTDDQAVVLSSTNLNELLRDEQRPGTEEDAQQEWNQELWRTVTIATVIDVSDPAAPRVAAEHVLDGYTIASRRIGQRVYLTHTNDAWIAGLEVWPNDLAWDAPADVVDAAFEGLRQANIQRIAALPISHWLPRRYELDASGHVDLDAELDVTACTSVYRPSVYSGRQVLTVSTLDLDAPVDTAVRGSSIIGDWGNVYASQGALYIGATNWTNYWIWEGTEDAPPITTHIHKFAFGDDGQARYSASGTVEGYAINQFAFDEYDGRLRVATTEGFGWWNTGDETESRVTILEQASASLNTVGMVGGLGLGEQIYSVRFEGDTGYVVTFRQVDPLYVIDLSNARQPKVSGELKIPGFSTYMQKMDAGHLLAIGRDASDEGQVQGLQFQIFDVTDPSNPTAAHKTTVGSDWSTWSDATYDHHAFVYYSNRDLLAVPVSGWESDNSRGYWQYRSELFLFRVTVEEGIVPLGEIGHTAFLEDLGVDLGCRDWYGWNNAWIRRGVFIEDYLYSLSNLGVMVHDTRAMSSGAVAQDLAIDPDDFDRGYTGACYDTRVDDGQEDPDAGGE